MLETKDNAGLAGHSLVLESLKPHTTSRPERLLTSPSNKLLTARLNGMVATVVWRGMLSPMLKDTRFATNLITHTLPKMDLVNIKAVKLASKSLKFMMSNQRAKGLCNKL